jgi:hypothetical protein
MQNAKSAITPKADMCSARGHASFGPKADIGMFNHFTSSTGGMTQLPSIAALRGEYSLA